MALRAQGGIIIISLELLISILAASRFIYHSSEDAAENGDNEMMNREWDHSHTYQLTRERGRSSVLVCAPSTHSKTGLFIGFWLKSFNASVWCWVFSTIHMHSISKKAGGQEKLQENFILETNSQTNSQTISWKKYFASWWPSNIFANFIRSKTAAKTSAAICAKFPKAIKQRI